MGGRGLGGEGGGVGQGEKLIMQSMCILPDAPDVCGSVCTVICLLLFLRFLSMTDDCTLWQKRKKGHLGKGMRRGGGVMGVWGGV